MPNNTALPLLWADWAAPAGVGAAMSTRAGGVSVAPYDSLNLRPPGLRGDALDQAEAVLENQRRFALALGATPVYLNQVHGAAVVRLDGRQGELPVADASVTTEPGLACTVLVADCLPVLFCSADGRAVGAAHAGWRGFAGGGVENCLQQVCELGGCAPQEVHAWLGACIGPTAFEVGADVLLAFSARAQPGCDAPSPDAGRSRFIYRARADGSPAWRADLAQLARDRLAAAGVQRVHGGQWCTVSDGARFFSFRRDVRTGRLAAAVWRHAG
jgi:YfiH family protein